MENKENNHWRRGGLGITNFDPNQTHIYILAIIRANMSNVLMVSPVSINNAAGATDLYSLRYVSREAKDKFGNLSPFWRVFDKIHASEKREDEHYKDGGLCLENIFPEEVSLYALAILKSGMSDVLTINPVPMRNRAGTTNMYSLRYFKRHSVSPDLTKFRNELSKERQKRRAYNELIKQAKKVSKARLALFDAYIDYLKAGK